MRAGNFAKTKGAFRFTEKKINNLQYDDLVCLNYLLYCLLHENSATRDRMYNIYCKFLSDEGNEYYHAVAMVCYKYRKREHYGCDIRFQEDFESYSGKARRFLRAQEQIIKKKLADMENEKFAVDGEKLLKKLLPVE